MPSPKVACARTIANRKARVVMNRAALDELQLAMADGLLRARRADHRRGPGQRAARPGDRRRARRPDDGRHRARRGLRPREEGRWRGGRHRQAARHEDPQGPGGARRLVQQPAVALRRARDDQDARAPVPDAGAGAEPRRRRALRPEGHGRSRRAPGRRARRGRQVRDDARRSHRPDRGRDPLRSRRGSPDHAGAVSGADGPDRQRRGRRDGRRRRAGARASTSGSWSSSARALRLPRAPIQEVRYAARCYGTTYPGRRRAGRRGLRRGPRRGPPDHSRGRVDLRLVRRRRRRRHQGPRHRPAHEAVFITVGALTETLPIA